MHDHAARGFDAAVQAFRVAALAWMVVVTALSFASIDRVVAAAMGLCAAAAITWAWSSGPLVARLGWRLLVAEVVVGAAAVAADGFVYDEGRAQSFGSVWPLAGVFAVAVRFGTRPAVAVGLGLGVARAVGELAFVGGEWSATRWLAIASTAVLFCLAGWAAAWAATRIRAAERDVAIAGARAEVAAELHDGVLQTLAVVQRRSDDDDLIRLARTQEAELRQFLAAPPSGSGGPVGVEALLRDAAADAARRFSLRIEVAVAPPLPVLESEVAAAVRGALNECIANVAKHAGVDRAVAFAEHVDGRLSLSVSDRGAGFDSDTVERRGLGGSVIDRMASISGDVEIHATPGSGTTIVLHAPVPLHPGGR